MQNNIKNIDAIVNQLHTSGTGYDLIRYFCLPDLLGKDANTILYVMGKNLARNVSIKTMDELAEFFTKVGWGELILVKEKRRELIFELTGEAISNRYTADIHTDYRLEAGFLAGSMELIKEASCECIDEGKKRKQLVQFNVMYTR